MSTAQNHTPTPLERTPRHARPNARPLRLLIVDEVPIEAQRLKLSLEQSGRFCCHLTDCVSKAFERLRRESIDAVVTGLAAADRGGSFTRALQGSRLGVPVFVLGEKDALVRAEKALRANVTACLIKPIDPSALTALIENAVAVHRAGEQRDDPASSADGVLGGEHPRLDEVRRFAQKVARVPEARVLITGESGTGKSLLARLIHQLSGAPGRLVEINCAALPTHLLESELFGHERGAFTDARAQKAGLIELADRGTLFLDEIGSMPLELQPKLLLFLETRDLRRVGAVQTRPIRCRVIAATNQDLRQLVRERQFREDLLYRLDVAHVEMPPLRAMPAVIPQLTERLVAELAEELGQPLPELSPDQLEALMDYPWPGNVRELRNAVERSLLLRDGEPFDLACRIEAEARRDGARGPLTLETGLTLEEVERRYMAAALAATPHELGRVAEALGISRKTLWEKRRRYGL